MSVIIEKEEYKYNELLSKLSLIDLSKDRIISKNFRDKVRKGLSDGVTSNVCRGYVQLNYAFINKKYVEDFKQLCLLNPKPFPLIEIGKPGDTSLPVSCALGVNVLKDIGEYIVIENGVSREEKNIDKIWNDNYVSVVYGCSFSFDQYLLMKDWKLKHIEQGKTVSMYRTKVNIIPYGVFQKGTYVVTMRLIYKSLLKELLEITKRLKAVHGSPIYYGFEYKEKLGIDDLSKPDWGDSFDIEEEEIPVFWACGLSFVSVLEQNEGLEIGGICGADTLLVSDILTDEIIDLA